MKLPKLYLFEPYRYKILDIDLRPSYRCNLCCVSCGSWKRKTPDLSLEQTKQMLKYFKNLRKWIVEGGEPLLWEHLIYFLKNVEAEDVAIITNGYFTERIEVICNTIPKDKFRWVVSLNGIGAMHDWSRGRKGAFDALVKSCDIMADKGFDIRFQFVCMKENIHELQAVRAFIKERYGREYMNLSYPSDAGIYGENIKATYLNNEDMRHTYMTDEFKFDRQGLLNKLIHDIFTEKVGKGELIPCLYGRSKIHINPEGKIFACQYNDIPELWFGTVTDDKVEINQRRRRRICRDVIPSKCQYFTGRLSSHEAMEYSIRHNFFYLLREAWKRLI